MNTLRSNFLEPEPNGLAAIAGIEQRDVVINHGSLPNSSSFSIQGSRVMKCSKRSFAVVSILFTVLLPLNIEALKADDADLASRTFAAAQTTKQQCINTCRARYRDCRRQKQLPSFECQGVYQDCTRYTCTGLGPG